MLINSLMAGMIFLMLWGRGIVRGRARRAGLLKATLKPKEKSVVDGFIHVTCAHGGFLYACVMPMLRLLRDKMITNGAMVAPDLGSTKPILMQEYI